jgi:hypothetical protein
VIRSHLTMGYLTLFPVFSWPFGLPSLDILYYIYKPTQLHYICVTAIAILCRCTSTSVLAIRASGIARYIAKQNPITLYNPNTPFLFIKLLRKHLNSNLLSFIFIILYFQRI